MTNQPCALCTRPGNGGFVCTACTATIRKSLQLVADLSRHADDKRARFSTNWRTGTIGRTPEQPLPYDPRVTAAMTTVTRTMRDARDQVEAIEPAKVRCEDHAAAIASWLTSRLHVLRVHPSAERHMTRIRTAGERLEGLFDRPPERMYVGRCNHDACPESLYVDRDGTATVAKCPKCAHETPIAERRDELAVGVENYNGTVKEISRLLRETLGDDVSERMIRGLADHGMIQAHGSRLERDKMGRHREAVIYRIGDVRAAVGVMRTNREQARAVRRHARKETA